NAAGPGREIDNIADELVPAAAGETQRAARTHVDVARPEGGGEVRETAHVRKRRVAVADLRIGASRAAGERDVAARLHLDVAGESRLAGRVGEADKDALAAIADLGVGNAERVGACDAAGRERDGVERGDGDVTRHRDPARAAHIRSEARAAVADLDVAGIEGSARGARDGTGLHRDAAAGADRDGTGDRAGAGERGAVEPT